MVDIPYIAHPYERDLLLVQAYYRVVLAMNVFSLSIPSPITG